MSRSRTKRPLTNRYCRSARARAASGWPTRPSRLSGPATAVSVRLAAANSVPSTSRRRCVASAARHWATRRPSCQTAKPTSGRASAWRRTASSAWASSVASVLRNLRRAGVLKNSSCTSTVVPTARAAGCNSPLRASSRVACGAPAVRLVIETPATEAIAASASPRNPIVATDSSSASEAILLVAWRFSASGSSAASMPAPSSSTTMPRTPPAASRTVTWRAPASSALSTSSRTTDAGRSTTSPAAIWLTSSSGSSRMVRRGGDDSTAVIDAL